MTPLHVECLVVGLFEVNCWLVWGSRREALVIDPGADAPLIQAALNSRQLTPVAYLATHGHMDHISALAELVRQAPAPVGMHPADCQWAFSESNQMPPYYGVPKKPPAIERMLSDPQTWTDGGIPYTILETPGHSPGSLCIHMPDAGILFTGDTLFQGTVGRTDLPGGNGRTLAQSLKTLARLPPETRILAGHGAESTLTDERRSNPFLK